MNTIQFLLNDKVVRFDFSQSEFKPLTTVLKYLRSLQGYKGTKEGCGQGDCGACTVVVGELDEKGEIRYQNKNSCLLFLPMLHGKILITVEGLSLCDKYPDFLHPAQKVIIDHYGSQCGFCTPGIVMSLFALQKNHTNPPVHIVQEALAGNLCRCTGYQFIQDAALQLCKMEVVDYFTEHKAEIEEKLFQINADANALALRSGQQVYLKPFVLEDALDLKAEFPESRIIAGATDLAVALNKRRVTYDHVLDISSIRDIQFCFEDHANYYIGIGTTLEDLKVFAQHRIPVIAEILQWFGSLQIRNSATIGGNIGSASPIGDLLPLLSVFNAKLKLASSEGNRIIEFDQFIKGYRQTDLNNNELITMMIIPKPDNHTIIKAYKISKRKETDISTVSAAFRLTVDSRHIVTHFSVVFGGMAETIRKASLCESFITDKTWNKKTVTDAMPLIEKDFTPISDARSGKEYRQLLAKNLLLRFFNEHQNF